MLPSGWIKTDLHKFIEIKHGFAFKSEYFREKGKYVLLTPGSFYESGGFRDQGSKTKYYVGDIPSGYLLAKNGLLIAMTEQAVGLLGSTLFVPGDSRYLHNQRLGLVQIQSRDAVCSKFLYLTYNSPYIRKQITEQSTGTKVKHTSPDKLKSVVCLLPPLPEQLKIALIISTWDKAIATMEKLIESSKQQKKALMQQLLTGKKRLINPETCMPYQSGWEEVVVSSTAKCFSGGTPSRKKDEYFGGVVPWITSGKLNDRFVNSVNEYITEEGVANSSAKYIKKNSVLIAMYGATAGKVALNHLNGATINQAILALETSEHCSNIFLFYLLERKMEKALNLVQGGQPNLNASIIKGLKIQLPLLEEQQKIASVLTAADNEIQILDTKLSYLQQEKKALMQQLLTGKRRVKVEKELEIKN